MRLFPLIIMLALLASSTTFADPISLSCNPSKLADQFVNKIAAAYGDGTKVQFVDTGFDADHFGHAWEYFTYAGDLTGDNTKGHLVIKFHVNQSCVIDWTEITSN